MPDVGALAANDAVVYAVVGFIAGMCVPFKDGMKSLRGFGRWAFAKLPQEPPENEAEENVREGE